MGNNWQHLIAGYNDIVRTHVVKTSKSYAEEFDVYLEHSKKTIVMNGINDYADYATEERQLDKRRSHETYKWEHT